tara:strand:+ start:694 stop:1002 length:309 start_codon:yes stop_codon:yes gene_type:complete
MPKNNRYWKWEVEKNISSPRRVSMLVRFKKAGDVKEWFPELNTDVVSKMGNNENFYKRKYMEYKVRPIKLEIKDHTQTKINYDGCEMGECEWCNSTAEMEGY